MKDCKYRLPCNWCDKYDRRCEHIEFLIAKENYEKMTKVQEECECDHDYRFVTKMVGSKTMYQLFVCCKCGAEEVHKTQKNDDGTYIVTVI